MAKTKIKKWTRKILIGLLIATAISVIAPVITNNFVDGGNSTVYADDPCKQTGETRTECTLPSGVTDCYSGYTKKAGTTNTCTKQTTSTTPNQQTLRVMEFLIQMQNVLNRVIWPVLVMIGGLTDNSLLFGNGMEDRLREIWIPIRNIVNILFVIALVGIALYNVLGIGDENSNYSIKAILPKIIVGIIVVNFSFLGIKVFLDGINVLTTAIFALPNQISGDKVLDPTNPNHQVIIDKYCRGIEGKGDTEILDYVVIQKESEDALYRRIAQTEPYNGPLIAAGQTIAATDSAAEVKQKIDAAVSAGKMDPVLQAEFLVDIEEHQKSKICALNKSTNKYELTTKGALFLSRWNARNASLAMALGLSKIVYYKNITLGELTDVEKIVINTVLSLMMYLLYAASFIALFVVLLGRLVVMWLAIALSPVLLLGMVVPAVKENVSGFGDIQNQFIKNAIAPLGIALSLSVGWIMLKALNGLNSFYSGEGAAGATISFSANKGIPVVGLTTLQDLLVGVGTLAVIWLGVFTAASNSIAAPVTDKLKGALRTAGTWLGTLPLKHAPIFHIDLPGVEGKENYTGTQVMEAISQLAAPKEPSKLANLLTGKQRVNPADLKNKEKYKTPDGVFNWLKNAKTQNMSGKDLRTAMGNLARYNPTVWNNIRTNHKTTWDKMDAMRKSSTKKLKDNRDTLLGDPKVSGASGLPTTTPKGKPPQVTNVTVSNTVNGKALTQTQVSAVNPALKLLAGELAPDDPTKIKKQDVEKHLKTIRDALPGAKASELRTILGQPVIDKLTKVYGNKDKVDKVLLGK